MFVFLLFQRRQPCTENPADYLLITVCIFNYNNSTYDLAKWQVSSSPLHGAGNFFASREILKLIFL